MRKAILAIPNLTHLRPMLICRLVLVVLILMAEMTPMTAMAPIRAVAGVARLSAKITCKSVKVALRLSLN